MRARRGRLWQVVVFPALLALAAGCGPDAPAPIRNLVFIVVDTLRADHLGAYGYGRETSPHVDALAAEGVRFERAYATSGWTAPSVASMLTGVYPRVHGLVRPQTSLGEELPTLAELLRREGFATAAVVSNRLIGRRYGFDRGFDSFDERNITGHVGVSTDGVTRSALEALERLSSQPAPFFLFVHYFDPHYAYQPHADYRFGPQRQGRLRGGEDINLLRKLGPSLTEAELDFIRALYDGEIRYTDAGIGRLLAELEAGGHYEDTLIVFTADHGEEFLERGWLGHTRTLYDELVRVPLILRLPRAPGRRVIDEPVSQTALPATFFELLGLETPAELPAGSLVPNLTGQPPPEERPAVLTEVDFVPVLEINARKTAHLESLVGPRYKLIRDLRTGALELYDLLPDPGEREDLAAREPERVASLAEQLDTLLEEIGSAEAGGNELELSEDEIKELRALGYGE